jgi:arylsulfatase A-like enzyme
MPTVLALAGGKANEKKPFDGKDAWGAIAEGKPSPHEHVLINVELFRGAIRKGKWKLIKIATLPGKVELFDLEADIAETTDVAASNPEVAKDLEARLEKYAKQAKMSQWLLAQQDYFGLQGQTVLDLEYNVDRGPENEKAVLPGEKK